MSLVEHLQRLRDNISVSMRQRFLDDDRNPLTPIAIFLPLAIAVSNYSRIRANGINVMELVKDGAVLVPFLILYFRKSPWAWTFLFGWFVIALIVAIVRYPTYSSRIHSASVVWFIAAFQVAIIGYLLFLRQRYNRYLDRYYRYRDADREVSRSRL
jgi:hypothetical protein